MRATITALLLFFSIQSFAQTYYSQTSGDPDVLSNWNDEADGTGSAPTTFLGSNDVFIIQSGHTMTTTNDAGGENTSGWRAIASGGKLQIAEGGTLQADYEFDMFSASGTIQIDNGGTYNHNNSTTTVFDGSTSFAANSNFVYQELPSGTIENVEYGNLSFNYSTGGNGRFNAGNTGTITIKGSLTIAGTSSSGSDEIRCATGSASGVTLDIGGDFIITGGTFNFYSASGGSNGVLNVGGDLLFTGGEWDNDGTDNLTVNFTTDNESSDINLNGCDYSGAELDVSYVIPTDKTLNMLSNWVIDETITINGQLNFGTFNIDGSSTNSSFVVNSGGSLGIGATDGIDDASTGGNIRYTQAKRSISTLANIIYSGSGTQETGDGLDDIGTLTGQVQISNTNNTVTFTEDLAVGDGFELIVDEGATLLMNSGIVVSKSTGTATLTINGTVEVEDDDGFSTSAVSGGAAFQGFTSCSFGSNGLINYVQSGSQTITNQFSYGSLTLSGTTNKTAAGSIDVNGDLLITGSATFIPGSNQINIGGSFTLNSSAILTESGSTIVFDGIGNHTISCTGTPENFDNVQFTSSGTYNLLSDLRINSGNTLTISGACTLNTGDNEFDSPSGNLVMNNGIFNFETVTANDALPDFNTISLSGGTIELGGSGDQELNGGETYNNLTFNGSGNKTISTATNDINGTVYITESCTLNVANSTFGDGTTDLTMDNGYFIVEGSGTKPDIGGSYSLTGGTIEFAGTSSTSARSPLTYNNVVISGTGIGGSSGNYTLRDGSTFTVNSGAQFTVSNQRFLSSGTASVVINGTFETEDADGLIGTSNQSIDAGSITLTLGSNSTIEYGRGGNQAISDIDDYVNLTVSGSGIKIMSGTPSISGDYSILAGSVNYPTSITFNGTASQNIAGNNFGAATVIFDGGGEKDLDADAIFNSTITFTDGVLDIGNNDITLGSSAVVSSANADSYFKINGTGRVIKTITNGTDYLFPVGENPYLPVTVSCAACTNEEISVGVENVIYDDPEDETTTFATAGHTNYVNKTWDLNTDGISGGVTIELQWNSSDQTTNPGSNNASNDIGIGYWEDNSSSAWNPGTITSAGYSGTIYTQERTLSGLNSGLYYLGVGANSSPLPVEFAYFKANCLENGHIQFNWKTFIEENNSHFNLQISEDGLEFITVAKIMGQGTTLNPTSYQQTLENWPNIKFARLKQIDFDGSTDYSNSIKINCNNRQHKIEFKDNRVILNKPETINVFTPTGALVKRIDNTSEIDLSLLGHGMYLIQIGNQVEKVIVR